MSKQRPESAYGLEQYGIDPDQWEANPEWKSILPVDVIEELSEPYPIMLGKHPTKGWFVLGTGQGPYIIWTEWDNG